MGTKGPNGTPTHTILGAISAGGVINLSIRIPRQPPKVRKIQGGKKGKNSEAVVPVNEPKEGTTTEHYLRFLTET
ncbi:hypothetical protein BDF20DRAFT_880467, partial [Mycotypha africana]|uniref:uncharacterized protein n=1 Tax=Mycotypha africana TaxID=64632 RepID=UPI0023013DA6